MRGTKEKPDFPRGECAARHHVLLRSHGAPRESDPREGHKRHFILQVRTWTPLACSFCGAILDLFFHFALCFHRFREIEVKNGVHLSTQHAYIYIYISLDRSVATILLKNGHFRPVLQWKWPKKRDNILCTVLIFYCFFWGESLFQSENPLFPRLGPNIWAKLWLQISLGAYIYINTYTHCTPIIHIYIYIFLYKRQRFSTFRVSPVLELFWSEILSEICAHLIVPENSVFKGPFKFANRSKDCVVVLFKRNPDRHFWLC